MRSNFSSPVVGGFQPHLLALGASRRCSLDCVVEAVVFAKR